MISSNGVTRANDNTGFLAAGAVSQKLRQPAQPWHADTGGLKTSISRAVGIWVHRGSEHYSEGLPVDGGAIDVGGATVVTPEQQSNRGLHNGKVLLQG